MTVFDLLERWKRAMMRRGFTRIYSGTKIRESFDQMSIVQGQFTDVRLWTNVPKIWILENSRLLFLLENL